MVNFSICNALGLNLSILAPQKDLDVKFLRSQKVMLQRIHPKGPLYAPLLRCNFKNEIEGECSVHILRGPCLNRDTLTTINLSFLVMEIGLEHGRQVKVASVLKHH